MRVGDKSRKGGEAVGGHLRVPVTCKPLSRMVLMSAESAYPGTQDGPGGAQNAEGGVAGWRAGRTARRSRQAVARVGEGCGRLTEVPTFPPLACVPTTSLAAADSARQCSALPGPTAPIVRPTAASCASKRVREGDRAAQGVRRYGHAREDHRAAHREARRAAHGRGREDRDPLGPPARFRRGPDRGGRQEVRPGLAQPGRLVGEGRRRGRPPVARRRSGTCGTTAR